MAQAKLCQPCCALENGLDNVSCSAGDQEQGCCRAGSRTAWLQVSEPPLWLVAQPISPLTLLAPVGFHCSLSLCAEQELPARAPAGTRCRHPRCAGRSGSGVPLPAPTAAHGRAILSPVPVGRDCRDVPSPLTRPRAGCRPRAGRQEPFGSRKLQGRKTGLGGTWEAGRAGCAGEVWPQPHSPESPRSPCAAATLPHRPPAPGSPPGCRPGSLPASLGTGERWRHRLHINRRALPPPTRCLP